MKLLCLLPLACGGCPEHYPSAYEYINVAGVPPASDMTTFWAGLLSGFLLGGFFALLFMGRRR